MAIKLRPYQIDLKQDIYDAWKEGHKNVLAVMPTGMGKTKTFVSIAIDIALLKLFGTNYPTAILVHRKELVQQISLTLAEEHVSHNIIAPRPVIKGIVAAQRRLLNKQFYDYSAPITVISVDTLNARILKHEEWAKSIKFWITDEAAHLLKENKWGRAVKYFTNAIGLGVTATPQRLDKRGLGSHVDGVFDIMIQGPTSRWGIQEGFLAKYKIALPESDYETYLKAANEGSDYSKEAMIKAAQESQIVGDVVKNYIKFSDKKQAIVFASDILSGERIEKEFISKGIKAKLLTGETPDNERLSALIDYQNRLIQVLINIDLFDEGLDVPGIETVIMARPTMSLGKYLQCCGRGLRPHKDKPYMILIDHVGNVRRHGLPDTERRWTLDRISKRSQKVNLIRICKNFMCNSPFDRMLSVCPYCGEEDKPIPRGEGGGLRSALEQVDGDLLLLDPDSIRQLEKSVTLEDPARTAQRVERATGSEAAGKRAAKNQVERIAFQQKLADEIARAAGKLRHRGYGDRAINKRFYIEFGMTIWDALALPKAEMQDVMARLEDWSRYA